MHQRLILLLSFASGALALGYEILWARHLLNLFGSTTMATSTMLAAFMAGMALGAWAMGRASVRARHPLIIYAGLELGIGLYGLAFGRILDAANAILPLSLSAAAGDSSFEILVPLVAHFIVLVLPTTLMGATLPALATALQSVGRVASRSVAHIYGLNTLGGVFGAFITGFWALPALGLTQTQAVASICAIAVAAAAMTLDRTKLRSFISEDLQQDGRSLVREPSLTGTILRIALLLSGFAALGYEIIWTRILVLVMGSSTYAFTMMLGTYLLGLALGGLWIGRYLDRLKAPVVALQHIQLAAAFAAVLGIAAFPYLPTLMLAGIANLGISAWALGFIDAVIALALVLIPTFFLGAALPIAARLMQRGDPKRGRELGSALSWVSAGHVIGILSTALVIIPAIGLQKGVILLASLNVGAAILLWLADHRSWTSKQFSVPVGVACIAIIGWVLPSWNINIMTSGVYRQAPVYLNMLGTWHGIERAFSEYRSLFYKEGTESVVAVFERPTLSGKPHIILSLDGKVDASTGADMKTQVLSGHLPLAFVPQAQNALVIGLASGITVGALAQHPVKNINVVEIEQEVLEASKAFDAFSGAPLKDPRVTVSVEDGRQYLERNKETYDIIVSEPSNPWLSGSARLFTKEFFSLVREHLATDGVFVQWVPLYGLSNEQFQILPRTLLQAFPNMAVIQAAESDLLIVASKRPLTPSYSAMKIFIENSTIRNNLAQIGIHSAEELMALWIADDIGLVATLGDGPVNTDDNGLIEFGSPWYVLRDMKVDNQATLERATTDSSVAVKLVADWIDGGSSNSVAEIARLHLTEGRFNLARDLAKELRSRDAVAGDILLGGLLAEQGDPEGAIDIWQQYSTAEAWLNLANLELNRGNFHQAATLYSQAVPYNQTPETAFGYGLALAALNDVKTALNVLKNIRADPLSVPDVVTPLIQSQLYERLNRKAAAKKKRREFLAKIDRLRARLEIEAGQGQLNELFRWINRSGARFTPEIYEELRTTIHRRLIVPLQTFYRGVSLYWLGDYELAEDTLVKYLSLVEKFKGSSKGEELIQLVRDRKAIGPVPL